ncbi:hypothetical protein [Micromonospora matsumotoense]|uniref:hypothetical protein n=1 Tax=Micromonospora matsumotoense TaxID=121616 RepID=UPI0033E9B638
MRLPRCKTHGKIASFVAHGTWHFTEEGPAEGMRAVTLDCGCHYEAVRVDSNVLNEGDPIKGKIYTEFVLMTYTGETIIVWDKVETVEGYA